MKQSGTVRKLIVFLALLLVSNFGFSQNYSGHSLFVCENGEIRSFGRNASCQLGLGSLSGDEHSPAMVAGGYNNTVAVAIGYNHSLALLDDGTVLAWGSNVQGACGQPYPGVDQECTPKAVSLPGCAVAISAGVSFSMALLADGTVWCWGLDDKGQLGDGTGGAAYNHIPVQAGTFSNAIAISAGSSHALALLDDGTVMAWGQGGSGELGNNASSNEFSPVQVEVSGGSALNDVVKIDAGGNHSLALLDNGDVYVWGGNLNGQLGIGTTPTSSNYARKSNGFSSGFNIDVAAGSNHSVVLIDNGNTVVSGRNSNRQLGITTPSITYTPISGSTLVNALDIVIPSTALHGWAVKSNGELWSWGNNLFGSVGNGTSGNNVAPPEHINGSGSTNQCNAIPSSDNHPQPCCVSVLEDTRTELGANGDQTFSGGFSYSGQDMSINNTITLQNGNYFFTDCDIICWKDAQIVVESSAKLYIRTSSHLYACGDMWDGILVEDGGRVFLYSGSIIEDAEVAFDIQESGYYYAVDATFNRNYIHIRHSAPTTAGNNPYRVMRSKFLCQESIIPFNTTHATLLPPRETEYTSTQIQVSDVQQVLVGSSGNGNTFDNATYGVTATGTKKVEVLYSDFTDVTTIGTAVTYGPGLGGETIDISHNTYERSLYPIWCFDNDHTVRTHIVDNEIDFNGMGSPPPTGMTGITYAEITPASGGNLNYVDISENRIYKAPTGIKLSNLLGDNNNQTASIYVFDNTITHQQDASEQGAGIRLENVVQSSVVDNDISHPTSATNWWETGIRSTSGSNENGFYCNHLHHIGNGILFDGSQTTNTTVANNEFEVNHRAFMLNWGDIGPQPNGTGIPHDNRWIDPSYWDITNWKFTTQVIGTNAHTTSFDVRVGPPSIYYPAHNHNTDPTPPALQILISIIGSSWQYGCVVNGLHANFKTDGSEGVAELPNYTSIIEPAEPQSEREANQQWIAKYGLYNHLTRNSALAEETTALSDFRAENEQSNIGKLQRAIAGFNQTEVGIGQQEAAELNSIQPTNSVEQTLKDVLTILYANATDLRTLSEETTEQLREIAKRCPLDDGMGVYMARAALLSVDTLPKDYANVCELLPGLEESRQKTGVVTDAASTWFYPNPTGGELTVDILLNEDESATVEVFNLVGQIVFSETLRANEVNKIDIGQLTNGIYTARLLVDGNIRHTEKLSVAK